MEYLAILRGPCFPSLEPKRLSAADEECRKWRSGKALSRKQSPFKFGEDRVLLMGEAGRCMFGTGGGVLSFGDTQKSNSTFSAVT